MATRTEKAALLEAEVLALAARPMVNIETCFGLAAERVVLARATRFRISMFPDQLAELPRLRELCFATPR